MNTVIIIAGPTAVGKTAMAVSIARQFGTAVISADSRQCYREMTIGTAKPAEEELAAVPHFFINSHHITDEVNAARFEELALQYVRQIFRENTIAVLCGGTGLYIKAFCEGIDPMPAIPPSLRERVRNDFKQKGLGWLQEELARKDPAFFNATTEQQNPRRLLRALEVYEATGRSVAGFRSGRKKERPFRILKTALQLPREILRERIDQRVDRMMEAGLVEEVKSLQPYRQMNALQTVGYKEIFDYMDGRLSLPEALEAIRINTRRYAKRQMTWFRKDPAIKWFDARQPSLLSAYLQQQLEGS